MSVGPEGGPLTRHTLIAPFCDLWDAWVLLRAATLWALVGPRGGVCAFSCAAFAVSTLQFAQNQVRTAAMGAMLGLGALSLRRLDDLELFHQ